MATLDDLVANLVPTLSCRSAVTTVGTAPVLFTPLNGVRRRLLIQNTSAVTISVGGSTVANSNGWNINPNGDFSLPVTADCKVYVVALTTNNAVTYLELA
jgi:hypothetical protein